MTDQLQPKINTWWGNLPEKKREKWWSEGDFAYIKGYDDPCIITHRKGRTFIVAHRREEVVGLSEITPAPCDAFWWKLEEHLVGHLVQYQKRKSLGEIPATVLHVYTIAPDYKKYMRELTMQAEPEDRFPNPLMAYGVFRVFTNKDRRHALLDAALAVQERGEGC